MHQPTPSIQSVSPSECFCCHHGNQPACGQESHNTDRDTECQGAQCLLITDLEHAEGRGRKPYQCQQQQLRLSRHTAPAALMLRVLLVAVAAAAVLLLQLLLVWLCCVLGDILLCLLQAPGDSSGGQHLLCCSCAMFYTAIGGLLIGVADQVLRGGCLQQDSVSAV